jgi:glutathione S-transferase
VNETMREKSGYGGIAAYERAFKMLEDTLSETGGPWILGSNPSLADINLMPYAARLDFLGLLDLWIKDRPHVESWWSAARQWPGADIQSAFRGVLVHDFPSCLQ